MPSFTFIDMLPSSLPILLVPSSFAFAFSLAVSGPIALCHEFGLGMGTRDEKGSCAAGAREGRSSFLCRWEGRGGSAGLRGWVGDPAPSFSSRGEEKSTSGSVRLSALSSSVGADAAASGGTV